MNYSYCDKDLLEFPEKYQMSTFSGIEFIHSYSNLRNNALLKLNVDKDKSFEATIIGNFVKSKISIDHIHTTKFLSSTLIDKIKKKTINQNEEILEIFLKKFEVRKKIFTEYDKQIKEITKDYFDLKNYILLSANFIISYQQTLNLKYLNVCLKLNDLIISKLDQIYENQFKELFYFIIQMELDCISQLSLKKGIE
tara:strand:+ start:239 stop:826 length:588 start_codon:yes stop_codon:yes gene_type:complete